MSHEPHGKCTGQAGCNTDAASPPTALTPEEQADVEQWEAIRRQDVILARACTIITRLDARVGELEEEVANAHEALAVAVAAANEYGYEQCRALITQRDALARALEWAMPYIGDEYERTWPDDPDFDAGLEDCRAALALSEAKPTDP